MTVVTVTADDGSSAQATVTVAASVPVALLSRVTYDNAGLPPAVPVVPGRYVTIDMGYAVNSTANPTSKPVVDAIHAADPNCKCLAYVAPQVVKPGDVVGIGTFPYDPNLPESMWLHDSTGARIEQAAFGGMYLMDPADPGWQAEVAQFCLQHCLDAGFKGVFLDGINASLFWLWNGHFPPNRPTTGTLATNASFVAGMTALVQAITAALRPHGLIVVGNINGAAAGQGATPAIWDQYLSVMDGAMEESWCYGTDRNPVPLAQWTNALGNAARAETAGKLTMVNACTPSGDLAATSYALCSMLLVAGGHTSFVTSQGRYTGADGWLTVYDNARALGAPIGPYVVTGGVYTRQFAHGAVGVDPVAHTGTITLS